MDVTCPVCRRRFRRNYPGRVTCSRPCLVKRRGTYEDRFWARVKKGRKCWEWQGRCENDGYARIKRKGGGKQVFVHRLSWELANGSIPIGLSVLHKCDNRKCVRPSHLFLGTNTDNMQDMLKKGRANKARGERHGNAKLVEGDVRRIRKLYGAGTTLREIAVEYGVTEMSVSRIVRRLRWAHVG